MMYIKIYYLFSFIFPWSNSLFPLVKLSLALGLNLTCPWLKFLQSYNKNIPDTSKRSVESKHTFISFVVLTHFLLF